MATQPFKPDKFLLETIEGSNRVTYRAKLPIDLKEVEAPILVEPVVVVGTKNGAAMAQ